MINILKSANWRRSFPKNYSRTAVLAVQATWAIVVGQGDGVVNVCSDWLGFSGKLCHVTRGWAIIPTCRRSWRRCCFVPLTGITSSPCCSSASLSPLLCRGTCGGSLCGWPTSSRPCWGTPWCWTPLGWLTALRTCGETGPTTIPLTPGKTNTSPSEP